MIITTIHLNQTKALLSSINNLLEMLICKQNKKLNIAKTWVNKIELDKLNHTYQVSK